MNTAASAGSHAAGHPKPCWAICSEAEARITQRADGSWLIDGMMHIDEVEDLLTTKPFSRKPSADYQTLAVRCASDASRTGGSI
jgi:hypothetical protein